MDSQKTTATINDQRFESLLSEITTKSGATRDKILELIQAKKAKVGGGYLTDQGALFLVASDLGVAINYSESDSPVGLSQLRDNEKSVTVIARIMSIGIPKRLSRKNGSGEGMLVKLALYDNTTSIPLNLWDRAAKSALLDEKLKLALGDLVKVSNAYTRPNLDGSISLNLGEKGSIEKIAAKDEGESTSGSKAIELLEMRVIPPSQVSEGAKMLAVRGKIDGQIKKTTFGRSDGSNSELLSFALKDAEDESSSIRAVIWGNQSPSFSAIRPGDNVTLLNVRARISSFQNSANLEIHGDESTSVLEYFEEGRAWSQKLARELGEAQQAIGEAKQKTSPSAIPFVGRIVSMRNPGPAESRAYFLIADSQKRKISVSASQEALLDYANVSIDSVVICRPDLVDYLTLKASCSKQNSISKAASKRSDIITSADLFVSVEEIRPGEIVSLEAMCLGAPVTRDIQTKDGVVRRAEIPVSDHTGEIKVYGWRTLSTLLEGFSPGDKLTLGAVEAQSHEGKIFLNLKNYSLIEKQASTN